MRNDHFESAHKIKFDAVIKSYGLMANLCVAKYLSKKLKYKYIADKRDPISDYYYTKKFPQGYRHTYLLDFILSAEGRYKGNDKVVKYSREHHAAKLYKFMDKILGY